MSRLFSAIAETLNRSTLRALKHRNFALVELGGWFSSGGVWFYRIGIQVLTWDLTHSGLWLGIIAAAEAIPGIVLSPIAGAFADRYDRLVMARIIQVAIMTVTAILAFATLAGWVDIYVLLVAAMAHGAAAGFWTPVRLAIVPNLVPKEDLTSAIALHATLFNLARFLFPALAAPVLALWGSGAAFALNAASYLIYLVILFFIVLVNPDERAARGGGMMSNLKEGFDYATQHIPIKQLFLMLIFTSVFMRAYMELLPGISETMFGENPKEGVAILVSAAGFGAMVGALLVGNIIQRENLLRAYFISMGLAIFWLILFAATKNFWFGVASAAVVSGAQIGMNIAAQVVVQSSVKGSLRGRVMSLWGILNRSGPAIGALLLGWMAGYMGFQWPILLATALSGVVGFYVFSRRQIMRAALMEDTDQA
ncbi:MAG: MFS transporter [Rhodospirillales bacterium]|nr:MFS transporter [Rhodospirillales bacterium]